MHTSKDADAEFKHSPGNIKSLLKCTLVVVEVLLVHTA